MWGPVAEMGYASGCVGEEARGSLGGGIIGLERELVRPTTVEGVEAAGEFM